MRRDLGIEEFRDYGIEGRGTFGDLGIAPLN